MALKKNLFYNLLLSISQILFPLVSIPYISRVLSAEGIGKVSTIDSLTYFIVVIAELGLSTYGVREIAKVQGSEEKLKQRTNELISMHIVSTVATCIIYAISIFLLWQKIHSNLMVLFSVMFFFSNIFNCEWYYWGTEKFKYIAIRSILTRLGGLVFIFLLIKIPSDFEKYYGIMVCSILVNIVLNASQLLPSFKFISSSFKSDFKACLPSYFIAILFSIINMLDNVLLGFTSSFTAVAYYSNATKIVRIAGSFLTDSFIVFFSRTSYLVSVKKQTEILNIQQKTIYLIWILGIPLSVGLAVYSSTFTSIYFGISLSLVSRNLMILSIYPILKSFSLFFNKQILMPNHLDKIVLNGYIYQSAFFVISCFVLSRYLSDIGCSIAIISSEFLISTIFYIKCKNFLKSTKFEFFKSLSLIILTFILFFSIKIIIEQFFDINLFIFITEIILSLLSYFTTVYFLYKFSKFKKIIL